MPLEDDKNCQVDMWPVKLEMDMQLPKPAITRLCSDKNRQSSRYFKNKSPVRPMYGHDKNCQSMWPKKPRNHMLSVTKPSVMEQSTYKFNQDNKNCQSARKYSRKCEYTKSLCDGKNCQSANIM